MGNAQRRKGRDGEAEAARLFAAAGIEVRALARTGDRLLVCGPHGPILHGETKRHERLQLWQWIEQAEAECPSIAVPSVTFRRSHGRWYTVMHEATLAAIMAEFGASIGGSVPRVEGERIRFERLVAEAESGIPAFIFRRPGGPWYCAMRSDVVASSCRRAAEARTAAAVDGRDGGE